jgi:glycosyltransferase involved in cell wall biosynthesis
MRQIEKSSFLKKNVHLLGEVEERKLHELYAGAKIFVFPSLYEGFGYPPLEAMAYGSAVMASHVASLPEVCEDAAEYIDPQSVDSMIQAIDYLLHNSTRREELSTKGKTLFQKKKSQKNPIGEVIDACCRDS